MPRIERQADATSVGRTMERLDRYRLKDLTPMALLARALTGEGPGVWASDHRKEVRQFVGWHYVAITAIMRQFAQAQ